jgi:predicted nucleotidyltransferase
MEGNLRDIRLNKLNERAKELTCVYRVCEALKDENAELIAVFNAVLEAIPPGYQYPTVCETRIILEGKEYSTPDFIETQWMQKAEIDIDNHVAGEIQVCYTQDVFENGLVFLTEEQKLLNVIADHISRFIFYRRLKKTLEMATTFENNQEIIEDSSLLAYESDEHWKWRFQVSQKIADIVDFDRFGIQAIHLIGSTKDGKAGPGSDIDLLVHFIGNESQLRELNSWMEGWGLGLAELNFLKTGYRTIGSLIDCHIITNEDIRNKTSYSLMIGPASDSSLLLRTMHRED